MANGAACGQQSMAADRARPSARRRRDGGSLHVVASATGLESPLLRHAADRGRRGRRLHRVRERLRRRRPTPTRPSRARHGQRQRRRPRPGSRPGTASAAPYGACAGWHPVYEGADPHDRRRRRGRLRSRRWACVRLASCASTIASTPLADRLLRISTPSRSSLDLRSEMKRLGPAPCGGRAELARDPCRARARPAPRRRRARVEVEVARQAAAARRGHDQRLVVDRGDDLDGRARAPPICSPASRARAWLAGQQRGAARPSSCAARRASRRRSTSAPCCSTTSSPAPRTCPAFRLLPAPSRSFADTRPIELDRSGLGGPSCSRRSSPAARAWARAAASAASAKATSR